MQRLYDMVLREPTGGQIRNVMTTLDEGPPAQQVPAATRALFDRWRADPQDPLKEAVLVNAIKVFLRSQGARDPPRDPNAARGGRKRRRTVKRKTLRKRTSRNI